MTVDVEDDDPVSRVVPNRSPAPFAFILAGVLGAIHAAFSLYWAAGGTWLAWSLGTDVVESFRGREWLLAPTGAIKLTAALAPLMLARAGWPARRVTRALC